MKHPWGKIEVINAVLVTAQIVLAALLIFFSVSSSAQPAPRMGISPDRYQIVFDEAGGETQSLLVQNLSDEPLSLSLSVSNWVLNDDNQIIVAPPTESSLDQWIVINPLRVTVPPGSPQTIRWAIMPRLQPQQGEYRAIIFIEEELPPRADPDNTEIRMKMRYGLPIYAHVGESIESAELHGLGVTRTGDRLNIELSNDGNTHSRLSGNYGIWPTAEFPGSEEALKMLRAVNPENQDTVDFFAGNLPPSVILPGNRRNIPLPIELEETGEFTIQLNAGFAQLEINDALSFTKHLIDDSVDDDPAEFRVTGLPDAPPLVSSVD
ncbi:MAG: hypothetical protein GKR91_01335 [Pseudomonadales bacterium]|nr:hypothetical protein [Pseudomonadales bacterium]